jgi:DNA helicase-2/ATP-dependent DNA helicase PcrA
MLFANLSLMRFGGWVSFGNSQLGHMSRQYTLQHAPVSTSVHIDYAAELNEQQLAAVTAPPGPILVIAGAGSGKTRTLTYRVAYLLENGIDPRNILLLTFKTQKHLLRDIQFKLTVERHRYDGATTSARRLLRNRSAIAKRVSNC